MAHNLKVVGSNPTPATNSPVKPGFFMYRVYVIRNASGKFYIGLSENIDVRLAPA